MELSKIHTTQARYIIQIHIAFFFFFFHCFLFLLIIIYYIFFKIWRYQVFLNHSLYVWELCMSYIYIIMQIVRSFPGSSFCELLVVLFSCSSSQGGPWEITYVRSMDIPHCTLHPLVGLLVDDTEMVPIFKYYNREHGDFY